MVHHMFAPFLQWTFTIDAVCSSWSTVVSSRGYHTTRGGQVMQQSINDNEGTNAKINKAHAIFIPVLQQPVGI